MVSFWFLFLLVLGACSSPTRPPSSPPIAPPVSSSALSPAQTAWEKDLGLGLGVAFETRRENGRLTVILKNTVYTDLSFDQFLVDWAPRFKSPMALEKEWSMEAPQADGSRLRAWVNTSDVEAFQKNTITSPEFLRRLNIQVVDTEESLKAKMAALAAAQAAAAALQSVPSPSTVPDAAIPSIPVETPAPVPEETSVLPSTGPAIPVDTNPIMAPASNSTPQIDLPYKPSL